MTIVRLSDRGLDMIARFEGLRESPYQDIAGYWTVGYGHRITPREQREGTFAAPISEGAARGLLAHDVRTAEDAVSELIDVPLAAHQADALISFTFNLGGGALANSTLRRLLNQCNYLGAAEQFREWCKARVGGQLVTVPGLLARREREAQVFREGYGDASDVA